MISVISEESQINRLHRKFLKRVYESLDTKIDCSVGFQGGNIDCVVRYSAELDIWIAVEQYHNRFWNGFGIGRPPVGSNNSIVGEVNFPYEGINRRIAGVFAQEDNGNILVLHRGKIGGGKLGIGKSYFTDNFRGDFIKAIDGDRETEFCLVGDMGSDYFAQQIANFISEVHRVKNLGEGEAASDFADLESFSYTDEHSGRSVKEKREPVVIERTHGIVVNALAQELRDRGYEIGNDRNRDLFIHNKGRIEALFEIKTSSSTQCLYSAVGQLLLYSIPIQNPVSLFAVLPDKLSKAVTKRLSSLGIQVLYYKWLNNAPVFNKLDDLLKS